MFEYSSKLFSVFKNIQFWVLKYNYNFITISVWGICFVGQIGRSLGVKVKLVWLCLLINQNGISYGTKNEKISHNIWIAIISQKTVCQIWVKIYQPSTNTEIDAEKTASINSNNK